MNDEIQVNIPEYIEQIKVELDRIKNILKNENSIACCDVQIMLLLNIIVEVIYNINVALTGCYGDDEK